MKIKMKLICGALCAIMLVGVAYATAGSADDPLITLSYLENIFAPKVEETMETMVTEKSEELKTRFDELVEQSAPAASGQSSAFAVVTLSKGQVLTGDIGCEVMLRVGTATCVSSGSTGLVDVTAATTLADGKALETNHLYMVTISTRGVKATADTVKVLVRGPYTIEG